MKRSAAPTRGFTLLEIMIVVVIIITITTIALKDTSERILRGQIEAEDIMLSSFEGDFNRSLEMTDFDNQNLAAIQNEIPAGVTATAFSTSLGIPDTTNANDWFAKLGRLRGIVPLLGTAPTAVNQPEIARLLFNVRHRPRYMFIGPTEADKQRFIICDVIGDEALTLPPYSSDPQWFEALWQTNWETTQSVLPAYWLANLSANQQAAWLQGNGGNSNLYRLRIKRITVPKYSVTVQNNHLTNSAWVYWNGTANRYLSLPSSGSATVGPMLAGRWITFTYGTVEATAIKPYNQPIRKNMVFTVE